MSPQRKIFKIDDMLYLIIERRFSVIFDDIKNSIMIEINPYSQDNTEIYINNNKETIATKNSVENMQFAYDIADKAYYCRQKTHRAYYLKSLYKSLYNRFVAK